MDRLTHSLPTVALALALAPLAATGHEVTADVALETVYHSNVFVNATNQRDATAFRLMPRVVLQHQAPSWSYRGSGRLRGETFADVSGADSVHFWGDLDASYSLSPRTAINVSEFIALTNNLFPDPDDTTAVDPTDVNARRDRRTRNIASLGLQHLFSPRLIGSLSISDSIFRADGDARPPSDSIGVTSAMRYQLSQRQSAGGGLTYRYSTFSDVDGDTMADASQTSSLQSFVTWEYDFDDSLNLSFQGGPAMVWTDRAQPDTGDFDFLSGPRSSGSDVTFFGGVELHKSWKASTAEVSYSRSESPTTSRGANTILDRAYIRAGYRFLQLWRVTANGQWARRKSSFFSGINDRETTTYQFSASVLRNITDDLQGSLGFSYRKQDEATVVNQPDQDFDEYKISLNFRYFFQTLELD